MNEECLVDECNRYVHSRGLCRLHYQELSREVREGNTSWTELEELGLAIPSRKYRKGRSGMELIEAARLRKTQG